MVTVAPASPRGYVRAVDPKAAADIRNRDVSGVSSERPWRRHNRHTSAKYVRFLKGGNRSCKRRTDPYATAAGSQINQGHSTALNASAIGVFGSEIVMAAVAPTASAPDMTVHVRREPRGTSDVETANAAHARRIAAPVMNIGFMRPNVRANPASGGRQCKPAVRRWRSRRTAGLRCLP